MTNATDKLNIGYGKQTIDDRDVNAVCSALASDYLTQGPKTAEFEQALAAYCQPQNAPATKALAVNSGTAALYLAYQAAGITPSSRVWVPAISFVATANMVLMLGAQLDFIECDPQTGLMDLDWLEQALSTANANQVLPDLIVPVHLNGRLVDMKRLYDLKLKYGFKLVEDGCHALGASDQFGQKAGAAIYSEFCTFSFHPVKSITTGEGGAITTTKDDLFHAISAARSHGMKRGDHYPWHMQQVGFGINARISDFQAALGLSQLQKLDGFIEKRAQLAAYYDAAFAAHKITQLQPLPASKTKSRCAHHLYPVRWMGDIAQKEALMRKIYDCGIKIQVHYPAIFTQPFYQNLGYDQQQCPAARDYADRVFSLPLFPDLTFDQIDLIVERLKTFQ